MCLNRVLLLLPLGIFCGMVDPGITDTSDPRACLNRARCLHRAYLFYYSAIVAQSWREFYGASECPTWTIVSFCWKRSRQLQSCQVFSPTSVTTDFFPSSPLVSHLPRNVLTRPRKRFVSDLSRGKKATELKQRDLNGSFTMHLYSCHHYFVTNSLCAITNIIYLVFHLSISFLRNFIFFNIRFNFIDV